MYKVTRFLQYMAYNRFPVRIAISPTFVYLQKNEMYKANETVFITNAMMRVFLLPITKGTVLMPFFRSPSISLISQIIALININTNTCTITITDSSLTGVAHIANEAWNKCSNKIKSPNYSINAR